MNQSSSTVAAHCYPIHGAHQLLDLVSDVQSCTRYTEGAVGAHIQVVAISRRASQLKRVEVMSKDERILVEVAYALPHEQVLLKVELPIDATVLDAAQRSGITQKFAGLDLHNATFGIFGQIVAARHVLRSGDRVEIYRPLLADPKEVRKARAVRAKERKEQKKPG